MTIRFLKLARIPNKDCRRHLGDHHCAFHSERTLRFPYEETSLIVIDLMNGDIDLSMFDIYLPGPCYDTPLTCSESRRTLERWRRCSALPWGPSMLITTSLRLWPLSKIRPMRDVDGLSSGFPKAIRPYSLHSFICVIVNYF